LAKAISHKAKVEEGIRTNEGLLYLVTKFLYSGSANKIVTSDDARIFAFGTGVDLSHAVNNLRMFRTGVEKEEGEGSSLARRKALVLLEPQSKDRLKLKDMLDYREVDAENPNIRCSVDALHVLEYFALTYSREQFIGKLDELKTKYPAQVDEALSLARIINGSLEGDIEKDLCSIVIEKSLPVARSIADFGGS
jgi:putative DNA methylase